MAQTPKTSFAFSSTSIKKWGFGGVFELELVEERPGFCLFRATGKDANNAFRMETGGHRWQRIPPTEKRGRVHTSTITVAVLPVPSEVELTLDDRDLHWSTCRAGGSGGQNVNKRDTAVQLTHLPTGLMVRCEGERSQLQNKETARTLLRARLLQAAQAADDERRNAMRKSQLGSGQRGDKIRTVRAQDDTVTDHRSERRGSLTQYLRGDLSFVV